MNTLSSLPMNKSIELPTNTSTPCGATIRLTIEYRIRPTHSGSFTEELTMDNTVAAKIDQYDRYRYTDERDDLHFATTRSRENSDYLPPKHLPVEHVPNLERARILLTSDVGSNDLNKNDEVLIRESIVQHISEDEKSTSSEEVVFEEWSEEFRIRRTEEYDRNTNRLLRTTFDETSQRVKSDVIKEEYKEKNERIKGHKSYDVVKEVYRRVPAHTVDPTKTTIVSSIERPESHSYEEIASTPHIRLPRTPPPSKSPVHIERTPRERNWSSEDIYTTEIVYDSRLARDIESATHGEHIGTRTNSTTPPPISSANYDRVRPGQYPPIPSTNQATVSRVPSSNYDRISSIVTPSTHFSDRRQQEREDVVSEEYQVELEQQHKDRRSPFNQRQTLTFGTKQQRDETSEEEVSDPYVITGDNTYQGLSTIISEAGPRRDSDWRQKMKEVYTPTSDDERYDQFGKQINGNYTAQRVLVVSTNIQQYINEVQIKIPRYDKALSCPLHHAVKEILVCVSRESSSDETKQDKKSLVLDDNVRSRESAKKIISQSYINEDRPQLPKRSSSSSSIIDERRARFEQQQSIDTSGSFIANISDRPTSSRVGELKNAFESTTNGSTRDDPSKYKTPVSTSLTEQRRKLFEEQEQANKERTITNRRSIDEYQSNDRRISETHTGPSRVSTIKSTLESSTSKQTEPLPTSHTKVDITIKDKRTISSIDSDLSGASPPIHQSTPKSTKQYRDDDGHESEDELSDPTNKQDQHYNARRRTSATRLRDFSQSTPQPADTTYLNQRTKSSFTETNMENILSHVPTSKGKGLLIELSPHISHETPITSTTTKANRDTHKSVAGSDSGIFEHSTATSHHQPTGSSSSWRYNASSSVLEDANRTQTVRDSGVYVDSIGSQRNGRRQASDTDQTTIHGGDDSVSRSTFKYDTEIISNDQLYQQQQQQRNIRRQTTRSPASEYENIANYHSGISSQRKVPVTTESRTIRPKPLVVDEIETIETETRVECQVQRTHEIKESTTKTERTGSPHAPKKIITTTTTTTTTTAAPTIRSPESSSDEVNRLITPSKRVLLNERPQYYDSTKSNDSPIAIHSRPDSAYTPTNEIRQQTQTYRESGIHQHRYDSPQSDVISYPIPPSTFIQDEEPARVEETWFKPIQRDRSQDSLRHSPSSRSNIRTLSAGPRSVEVTSLSPQSQVTFGKYSQNQIIAIVRVPELSNGNNIRPSPSITSSIRHGTSEPELYIRAKQEEEEQKQQRSKLHYQRVQASSYRPPPITQDYQQRQSRPRAGPYETTNEYSSPLGVHTRSSSYHSALHEQEQQQEQNEYPYSPNSGSAYRRQVQHRTGSLGNLFGSNIEFEIEIEKRPPQHPEQPTVVALDQSTRAIVTTSKDGRVSIQNIAARPGNTVVINSDFHSSDRSLNRSSGYFSSDELRSQGLNTNYSSDEQSSGAAVNLNQNSQSSNTPSSSHARRYKNNESMSKLPSHYRPKQHNINHQQINNDKFDQVNRIVNRYSRQSNNTTGFNETIDQIDALYNNLDIQTNEDYLNDRSGNNIPTTATTTYDFSKPTSTTNRRKHLSQNANEYSKRYSSTGFQHVPSQYEQEITTTPTTVNSSLRHLVSPPIISNNDIRRNNTQRTLSDNENLNNINEHNRRWGSTSLNDLVMATPIRPSQSLSSSGILADYTTPGSISPNSGFGSTQNVILQQNRLNGQSQIVQRNRTSVKQVKQKSAAKKRTGNNQGQYSDEEDDNDSAGGQDSPLSDIGRTQLPTRSSNRHQ
ncbi:unnamed protein product [Adineta steineri]|uniref:Uncharacterized protein n=1 Tax=Adineta steineri TaxID=433720 RepID=A0A814V2T9_9BILA|nr:unnamed protein product [Adineta steineri]